VIGGIIAVAVAGTVTGGAIAFASNNGEGGASGPQADRAVQAALESTGGGVGGVERDGESGGVWEVEVHKPDGMVVDVRLDENYQVVVIDGDNETADTNDGSS
jgi:Peptidase propeptide and YPEB domain